MIRWKAQNPRSTHAYYVEPYTVQHFLNFLCDRTHMVVVETPQFAWFVFRYYTSRKVRLEMARKYNSALFGSIPTSQIMIFGKDGVRPLREEERTWPE